MRKRCCRAGLRLMRYSPASGAAGALKSPISMFSTRAAQR
ncbi:hypothetical protein BN129_372 [Cronobacter sakazakii 701]|nr:hypothetical protein BN129_372 [Cronobacter sakazakii 701]